MILRVFSGRGYRGRRGTQGFTLMELIVALAVMSVGVTVFVLFFNQSLVIARSSRDGALAGALAEEQLALISSHPDRYLWVAPEQFSDQRIPVRLAADDPETGVPLQAPLALPVVSAARNREQNTFNNFRWQAFARFAKADARHCELTVVVLWEESGRAKRFALTSALPMDWQQIPKAPAGAMAKTKVKEPQK